MADRTGGEANPVEPKEVFELDKDERWQARLDEARARREVALREKAQGKPQKPRLKPWEIEGSEAAKPLTTEPIVQDRGDEKFDFADRLEFIRDGNEAAEDTPLAKEVAAREKTTERPEPEPEAPTFGTVRLSVATPDDEAPARPSVASETRERPRPSLVLPDAPDVAELAARHAAPGTSPAVTAMARAVAAIEPEDDPEPESNLITLPTAATRAAQEAEAAPEKSPGTGIRPLGMAMALMLLAFLPLTTEAPPLEIGPDMPRVDVLRIQPALGVTWSLYARPVETRSGEWRARPAPIAPTPIDPDLPVTLAADATVPTIPDRTGEAAEESVRFGTPQTRPMVPALETAPRPVSGPPGASVSAASSDPGLAETPVPTSRFGAAEPRVGDPLNITVLKTNRSDPQLADDIATDVVVSGHAFLEMKTVEDSIGQRNLRYFHPEDRAAATQLAWRYGAELRDFTWFEPTPPPGTVEIWLTDRSAPFAGDEARGLLSDERRGSYIGRFFERAVPGATVSTPPDGN